MKFKNFKLGTGVYFASKQRDNITEAEFEMELVEKPEGVLLTHKRDGSKHFIYAYNIAHATVENDSQEENLNADDTGEIRERRASVSTIQASTSKKAKKP